MTTDEQPWLAADGTAHKALLPLAEALFRQQLHLGRLATQWPLNPEKLARQLPRINVTVGLLEMLESVSGLRFARSGLPYVSNTQRWRDDVPPVGVTGTGNEPAPSDVLHSLLLGWAAHSEDRYPRYRPLRATVQLIKEHGLDKALLRLIELARAGYVPRPAMTDTVNLLLRARDLVQDDTALVARLVPGSDAFTGPTDWATVDIDTDWLEAVESGKHHLPEPSGLISEALHVVDMLRASPSFDEWMVRSADVGTVLEVVLSILDRARERLPLGIRAVLSQLEENYADAGGFLGMSALRLEDGLIAAMPMLAVQLATIELVAHGHGGDRLRRQRVGLPSALEGVDLVGSSPPAEWTCLSIRLAPIVMSYFAGDFEFASPTGSSDADRVEQGFQRILTETDKGNFSESIRISEELLTDHPWSALLRHELAIALDGAGRLDEALKVIVDAVTQRPTDPDLWQSLAVILRRCGAADEQLRALAVQRSLVSRAG